MVTDNDQASIEDECSTSWDSVTDFFTKISNIAEISSNIEWLTPLLKLIAELRARGYDRCLLAAPSMTLLNLRRHHGHCGIPNEKSTLSINVKADGSAIISYYGSDEETQMEIERLEFTPELEALLQRLLAHPID